MKEEKAKLKKHHLRGGNRDGRSKNVSPRSKQRSFVSCFFFHTFKYFFNILLEVNLFLLLREPMNHRRLSSLKISRKFSAPARYISRVLAQLTSAYLVLLCAIWCFWWASWEIWFINLNHERAQPMVSNCARRMAAIHSKQANQKLKKKNVSQYDE